MSHQIINNQSEPDKSNIAHNIAYLIKSIEQERLCPDILSYQTDIVNVIRQQLKEQQSKLKQYMKDDTQTKLGEKNFKFSIYKYEIDRVTYLLKSYLRTRLGKIQTYSFYILKSKQLQQLLSKQELQFLQKYTRLRYQQYDQLVLKDLHKDFRNLDGIQYILGKAKGNQEKKQQIPSKQLNLNIIEPNKLSYRFFKVLNNPKEIRYNLDIFVKNIKPEQRNLIQNDDILFIPYGTVESLYQNHMGQLI